MRHHYTRHRNTVEPMMIEKDRKATLQALHTDAVNKAIKSARWSSSLSRKERSTLAEPRSGYCGLLSSYKSRIMKDASLNVFTLHTDAVNKAIKSHERNMVLDGRPPPKSKSEKALSRKERSTLAEPRSGYCGLLSSYKSRIMKDASLNVCADCCMTPHDVKHLFVCPAHPTTMTPSDLWSRPADVVRELSYVVARDPD